MLDKHTQASSTSALPTEALAAAKEDLQL